MLNLRLWTVMLALCVPAPAAVAAELVIDHATVLPMTGAAPMADTSVVIRGGMITALLRPGDPRPRGLRRIDARGKFLVPGLTDAHVHLMSDDMAKLYLGMLKLELPTKTYTQDAVLPYLAHGVTQVFNLQATADGFAQKAKIASGKVLGPTILSAAMIDGDPPIWPLGMTRIARTPEEGRAEVRKAAADGYQLIKPYSQLKLDTFSAIVDEPRKLSLPVVGHIPGRGQDTAPYMQPGFGMVAHAEEYAQRTKTPDLSLIPRYAELAKASSTGLIAYLEKIVAFNKALVKAFADAGIPILAGTDSSGPGVVPGFSLPDELAALVAAGLTNEQALTAATRAPCAWLKTNCGTIAPGMRADLLLLDANPLTNIAAARRIHALVLGGRLIGKADLDRRMAASRK